MAAIVTDLEALELAATIADQVVRTRGASEAAVAVAYQAGAARVAYRIREAIARLKAERAG